MKTRDFLFRRQHQVEVLYSGYLEQWWKCTQSFEKAMTLFLEQGNSEQFGFWCANTHKQESLADDIRRNIEFHMYAKALLPESRGDILGLLETIDKVINKVESVLFQIHLENINIPPGMLEHITRIFNLTCQSLALIHQAACCYFKNHKELPQLNSAVDEKESECDHAERTAIKALFNSDLPGFTKLQIKNLIIELGNISDRTETVSDRLMIMSVKRKV